MMDSTTQWTHFGTVASTGAPGDALGDALGDAPTGALVDAPVCAVQARHRSPARRWRLRLAALVLLMTAITTARADAPFAAVVVKVTDGDTLWVRAVGESRPPLKLRLQGIDAPERCQAWGPQATQALTRHVLHRQVQVRTWAVDGYRRHIAQVWLDGDDLGAWLTSQGHAWSQRFHRSTGPYAEQERRARAAGRGLFAAARPLEPRQFRRRFGPCP